MGGLRRVGDLQRRPTQDPHQLVVDHLHDLLARRQAARKLRPDQLRPQPANHVPHHQQVDVGLEQGHPDFPQSFIDVVLVEPAPAPQAREIPSNRSERASNISRTCYRPSGVALVRRSLAWPASAPLT